MVHQLREHVSSATPFASTLRPVLLGVFGVVVAMAVVFPFSPAAALVIALASCCGGAYLLGKRGQGSAPPAAVDLSSVRPASVPDTSTVVDPETGLANADQLTDILRREIARSQRYGDRSTLTVFEVRVGVFEPTAEQPVPPSPAPFVASILRSETREADVIARLDRHHFLVVVTECDRPGASCLVDRIRTEIGSQPYARQPGGRGIYARAWAGSATWDPSLSEPEAYLNAALADLERSRPAYDQAQAWFSGTGAD